eukprot:Gb_11000 [translate_table: standard]
MASMRLSAPLGVLAPSSSEHRDHRHRIPTPQPQKTHNTKTTTLKRGFQKKSKRKPHGISDKSVTMGEDVSTLCTDGRLKEALDIFNDMDTRCIQVNSDTYASLLQVCVSKELLAEGKLVHDQMLKSGFPLNNFIATKLVILYVKCGSLVDARSVFDKLRKRNVFSWTAMIGGYAKQGYCEEALKLYHEMQQEGVEPDHFTFTSVLKACAGLGSLQKGIDIHDCIARSGFESDVFVGNALIDMYAKCGSIENARNVFDKMYQRDLVSWNAMISGYAQNGHCHEAIKLFGEMELAGMKPNAISWNAMIAGFGQSGQRREALKVFCQMLVIGTKPDSVTLASVLSACASLAALQQGKEIHTYIIKSGFESDAFVGCALLDMYAKCGRIEHARTVFDKISGTNAVSWNAMIAGYAQNGYTEEAVKLFSKMQLAGVKPDVVTWNGMIAGYAQNGNADEALKLIKEMQLAGVKPDAFSWNPVIASYAQRGRSAEALKLFTEMEMQGIKPNMISWNSIIAGCVQNGCAIDALNFFRQMQLTDIKPNSVTIVSFLSACANMDFLHLGKEVHLYVIKSGFDIDVFVGSALIDMYAKCESIYNARNVFDRMPHRNVVSWNAMITGYIQNGHSDKVLNHFYEMQLAGVKPNSVTLISVLCACANLAALQHGKEIHAYIVRSLCMSDVSVGNALVNMYSKCRSIGDARQVFDRLSQSDVVLWNAIIAGYAQNGHAGEALNLFHEMQIAGLKPDVITWNGMISAYAQNGHCEDALKLFHQMKSAGVDPDVVSWNVLITGYAQDGRGDEALKLFSQMELASIKPNVVSWNAIIAGCAQNGQSNEALKLFGQMQLIGMKPNSVTMSSVLPACANVAALQKGKEIHCYIIRTGLESDAFVGCALLDMYAKCGVIEDAKQLFDKMSKRDVVFWNVMIAAFAMHGYGKDSLVLFSQMQEVGIKPDDITFTGVLSACSHAGMVDEGQHYFDCMTKDYCITPSILHYACMVDILGRAGRLDEAQDFIKVMPLEPDACVWGALLGACKIHCNIELGERAAETLFRLEPENAGNYVVLSNIYAAAGRWADVAKVRNMMKGRGLKKSPGCSWIEVKNTVHAFLVGDRWHPQTEKIYATLESLAGQMKEAGYEPDTNFVLHDVLK